MKRALFGHRRKRFENPNQCLLFDAVELGESSETEDDSDKQHALRGAIEYMTHRYERFERFLESGAIPIHNNATEQAMKNPVIGKKNWLFFGSPEGGEAAAVFYSLTVTCRRLKIDPLAYLSDVFKQLPLRDPNDETSLNSLLPDRWLTTHPESQLPMRVQGGQENARRKRTRRSQLRRVIERADLQTS